MAPIRVGFVGLSTTGWASIALAPPLLKPPLSSKFAITAVSTTSAQSAAASAKKYSELSKRPVKFFHGSTDQIASDPDVDLVVVAVKTPDHKAAVMPAIERGKDVFCEWPLGNGLKETLEIAEAARRKGIRTMVGLQAWQNPAVKKVKEWVAAGKIGKVLSSTWVGSNPVEVPYWAPFCQERDAYSVDTAYGATFLDVGVGHNLSAMIFALGPLVSISATTAQFFPDVQFVDAVGNRTSGGVKSNSADQLAFTGILRDSGAILTATWRGGVSTTTLSDKGTPSLLWIIDGDKGHIRVESTAPTGIFLQSFMPDKVFLNGEEVNVLEEEDTLSNTGRAFEEFAMGSEGVYPTFDDAVVFKRHVDAFARSAKEDRTIRLDA